MSVTPINANDDRIKARGLAWVLPEAGESAFCCSARAGQACAWHAELQPGSSALFHNVLDDTQMTHNEHLEWVAMSANCIAALLGNAKIISLCSRSGALVTTLSEGLSTSFEDDHSSPMCVLTTGEILISLPVMGAALCIWGMKQGALPRRSFQRFCLTQS